MKTQLKKNEKVILTIRRHWFTLVMPLLSTLFFFNIAAISSGTDFGEIILWIAILNTIWFIYRIVDRSSNLWVVTNLRIIDEYGVFSNNSKETPLEKINNVAYRQPLLGRIFDYGDIQIQSAAESGSTLEKMVERPKLLKDTITKFQEKYKEHRVREQAQQLANAVAETRTTTTVDVSEELTKLHDLITKGIISAEDFQKRKNKLLLS